jgi:hypothetical protein
MANYKKFEAPGTFDERCNTSALAADGWRVSSGFIVGCQTQPSHELMASFRLANELQSAAGVKPPSSLVEHAAGKLSSRKPNLDFEQHGGIAADASRLGHPAVGPESVRKDGYRHAFTGANLDTMN